METQYTFETEGNKIPYYHFYYENEFDKTIRIKRLKERKTPYLPTGEHINHYLASKTTEQFDFSSDYVVFQEAMIIILHSFDDYYKKDLDNMYYKPFIDAIRRKRIVADDSWKEISLTTIGREAEKQQIDVFVVPKHFYIEFLTIEFHDFFNNKEMNFRSIQQEEAYQKRQKEIMDKLF